jgi:hypothetical protein
LTFFTRRSNLEYEIDRAHDQIHISVFFYHLFSEPEGNSVFCGPGTAVVPFNVRIKITIYNPCLLEIQEKKKKKKKKKFIQSLPGITSHLTIFANQPQVSKHLPCLQLSHLM